jgi:hypothetical protein
MPSVEEIIAAGKRLVLDFKSKKPHDEPVGKYEPNPLEPFIHRKYLQVLAPPGFEYADVIVSFYIDENWGERTVAGMGVVSLKVTTIIHGHKRGFGCSLPSQCHVRGYKPTGNEPKPFLENWKKFGYAE